jgi:5-methylcytosine-specific restriction endonuclease McrA
MPYKDPAASRAQKHAYRAKHRARLAAMDRASKALRLAAMTPEEREAHRLKENARANASYYKHHERVLARNKTPERRAYKNTWAKAWYHALNDEERTIHLAKQLARQQTEKAKDPVTYTKKHRLSKRNYKLRRAGFLATGEGHDLTPAQEALVIDLANGVCAYCPRYKPDCQACKRHRHKLTVDHITPVTKGGKNTLHNLVACCGSCNSKKHTSPPPVPVQPLLL